jgi:RNA polymerase sigma factor (TIGR02999 family)
MSNFDNTPIPRDPGKDSEALLEKVYSELRILAASKLSRESDPQTLQPTALVHEAWLRLAAQNQWENTSHFFAAAAEAMRRVLIERARRRSRLKHGRGQSRVDLEGFDLAQTTVDDRVLLIADALELLEQEDAEKAQIVNLKFFAGLTNAEIAQVMNVTERTIERHWAFAKTWLYTLIEQQIGAPA